MNLNSKFDEKTGIIGVIGHPIVHSYSPLIHNFCFDENNLNYVYLPFDVPFSNISSAIKGMVALGFKGFNVTLPLKEKIGEYLNEISEEAAIVGAVNTVVNENGTLHGYNTDVFGILETLKPHENKISGEEVSVIGGGGAARSVIYALIRHFKVSKVNIINRTFQKAESLKDYFSEKMLFDKIKSYELMPPDLTGIFSNSKLIINTTSIGMYPDIDDSPTKISESFNEDQIVFDVIYNPLKTKFLEMAEEKGALTINGLTMFIAQAASAFEMWTSMTMDTTSVKQLIIDQISNSENGGN